MTKYFAIPMALFMAFCFSNACLNADVVLVAEDFDGNATVTGINGLNPSGGLSVTAVADPAGGAGNVGQVEITGGGQWQSLVGGTAYPLPANTVPGVDSLNWSYRIYVPSNSVYSPNGTPVDNVGSLVRVNGNQPDAFPPSAATALNPAFPLDTWVTITSGSGLIPTHNNLAGGLLDLNDPTTELLPILSLRITGNTTVDTITSGTQLYIDDVQIWVTEPSTGFLLGDVDLSGAVDFLDIAPFIAVLSSGMFQAEADCNLSGNIDFLDIAPFIGLLSGP